jgi:uncharacterized lipoprotein YddW (UPF0748 family)
VWLTNIDSDVLFSSQNVTNALPRLQEFNFNTVYPTVWNWGYTLYQFMLADWANWERRGLVEELIVQVYRDNFNTFISELEQPEVKAAKSHIPVAIGILAGLNKKPVTLSQIQQQVEAVRSRGFAGVSFFFYETLWNKASEPSVQRQSAFRLLFPLPAKPPDLSLLQRV